MSCPWYYPECAIEQEHIHTTISGPMTAVPSTPGLLVAEDMLMLGLRDLRIRCRELIELVGRRNEAVHAIQERLDEVNRLLDSQGLIELVRLANLMIQPEDRELLLGLAKNINSAKNILAEDRP